MSPPLSASEVGSEIADLDDFEDEEAEAKEGQKKKKKKKRISPEEAYRRRQAMRNGAIPIEGELWLTEAAAVVLVEDDPRL